MRCSISVIARQLYDGFPAGRRRGPEPPARAPGEPRAARRGGRRPRARRGAAARLRRAQERRLSPPVDPRRRAGGAVRGGLPRRRPRGGRAAASRGCSRARIAALPAPEALKDAKTRLQEYLQSRSLTLPRYTVLGIEGEDHAQTFRVSCEVPGLQLRVEGGGSSRRRAEQEAAERMLARSKRSARPDAPRERAAARGEFRSGFAALVGPAQRRQVDAAQRAGRAEAEHRHAASPDHPPPHPRRARPAAARRSPSSTPRGCTRRRAARSTRP